MVVQAFLIGIILMMYWQIYWIKLYLVLGKYSVFLSYQEIGSRAIASRALAGVYQGKLVFSLPGSTGAVKLGLEKLILPELNHLWTQINN